MAFSLTDSVIRLYSEIDLNEGEALRLYARYAGSASNGGYALGISPAQPGDGDRIQEVSGLKFFVKPDDQWLVDDMKLDYDEGEDIFYCEFPALN
ncbi:iron-sulfur cluster biosynthesis family protein [Fictibacillus terranigra]|uniref:Iron-sulfur cluster biosynthesis family protein n=1 Tax=Fictibacillus terranigra TaxID=3058424 RepID=A0ABT8E5W6_9BACL|nr:iron-sulfur cluster biosynthesis family protein [Fictibacillus sp. CENA-BCM004]MDN4073307.1 iron-sulfur cluster biosynthesis family protein [Fictibacillus sp. CENA-BCM004]